MKIRAYTGGFCATNGYVLETGGEVVAVDAPSGMAGWLEGKGLKATRLLLTHQHFDHVEDAARLRDAGAEICAFAPFSEDLSLMSKAREWSLPLELQEFGVDLVLEGRDCLEFGGMGLRLLHVPGHSPDSLCFYAEGDGTLFGGDTLFCGSVGRTDLPGHGNHGLLLGGIREKIFALPEETVVCPGHGETTTVGAEKRGNPFVGE